MAIVILADDLSGAAELAGIAFARGFTAEVQRKLEPASNAEVIAVDSDTRHLPSDQAAARVASLAWEIAKTQPAWIFKKVDSVLRGNIRVEIEAILHATGHEQAVLVPANPSRGRTIVGGQYLVDGVPLDQTQFARDPEHPRHSAHLVDLLGGGESPAAIALPDVAAQDDVRRIALQLDSGTLAAGAADFFAALLERRCGSRPGGGAPSPEFVLQRPALLVCGSGLAWRRRSGDCLLAGVSVRAFPPVFYELQFAGETMPDWAARAARRLNSAGRLLLGIGDIDSPAGSHELLSRLARLTALTLDRAAVATLLAEGGATAAAIAKEVGWQRFAVTARAPAGVGILQPLIPAPAPPAPRLLIKPGSYPWPDEIWRQFAAY